ncbi:hypothetical protein ACHAXN_012905 [Cyclotella atomus]
MARLLLISLLAIALGFTTAFFKQAVPHQEVKPSFPAAASAGSDLFDELDNPNIVSDSNITPARNDPGRRTAPSVVSKTTR